MTSLISVVIFSFGTFRAVEIGRGLASRIFRARAYWTGAVMASFIASSIVGLLPFGSSLIFLFVSFSPFFLALIVTLGFVDSTIRAANEMDFFHRDALRWSRVRIPIILVFVVGIIITAPGLTLLGSTTSSPLWEIASLYLFSALIGFVFLYSVVALIIAARRTYDKTMKNFVKLCGASLGLFVVALLVGFLIQADISQIISDILSSVFASYILYRAVMSLAPISRIEGERLYSTS